MDELKKRIINAIDNNRQRTLEIADYLLKNPELGDFEYKTSAFVKSELEKLGLTVPSHESVNWFCIKQIIFKGKAAHGGWSLWLGINAASMARQALNMIDSQRDTFQDADSVEINNLGGYMPYQSCAELNKVHADNLHELTGGVLTNFGHCGYCTDMGDASMLMPALHACSGGFSGSPHARDFWAADRKKACIQGAKLPAMNVITPLSNNGVVARKISAQPKLMDKQTYLNYKNRMTTREEYNYDQA